MLNIIISLLFFVFTLFAGAWNNKVVASPYSLTYAEWACREIVGYGSYGRVYSIPKSDGGKIAVKLHRPEKEYGFCTAPTEIFVLEEISKKLPDSSFFPKHYGCRKGFFWRIKGTDQYQKCWFHVMEYFPRSLQDLINSANYNRLQLQEPLIKKIIYPILCAAKSLHEIGYIHRDLKPENVLLSESTTDILFDKVSDFRVVVSDLGLAKRVSNDYLSNTTRAVTPDMVSGFYRPPENCLDDENQHYGFYTDTWSIGMIFLTLVLQENPVEEAYGKLMKKYPAYKETERFYVALSLNSTLGARLQFGKWMKNFPAVGVDVETISMKLATKELSAHGRQALGDMLALDASNRCSPTKILEDSYWDDVRKEKKSSDVTDDDWIIVNEVIDRHSLP